VAVQWITPGELPNLWDGAEGIPDDVIDGMLDASRDACEAWLPAEGDPERPRDRTIRLGQLTLVRGLWNDAIAGEDGTIGADGFDYNPPWLAREARRMMRPQRAGNSLATGHDDIPEVLNPDPVTVTWDDGSSVYLTRDAGIVTAIVTPAAIVASSVRPIPANYGPAGMTLQMSTGSGYVFVVDEVGGIGEVGMYLIPQPGELAAAVFTWLADPVVTP